MADDADDESDYSGGLSSPDEEEGGDGRSSSPGRKGGSMQKISPLQIHSQLGVTNINKVGTYTPVLLFIFNLL